MKKESIKHIAVWAVAALLVAACASIGSPDGGPYDETPPVFLGSEPEPFALGVKDKRVTLDFDEFIKIEKAAEKVVISPPTDNAAGLQGERQEDCGAAGGQPQGEHDL